MRIIIDADSVSSINLISIFAKENNIELLCFCDTNHIINIDYGTIKIVSTAYQNVDMTIINIIYENDILITNDYGLALLALSKKINVINDKGKIYNNKNIDELNLIRHINRLNRKMNIKTKNQKKRTKEMEENLINSLITIITK